MRQILSFTIIHCISLHIYVWERDWENFHVGKQILVEKMRKDIPAITFSNQSLNIMIFIFKHRIQKIMMIRNVLTGYAYESIICFCKINNFNQLRICLWMEYKNISDDCDFCIPMFKYENHDIQRLVWKVDGWIILSHLPTKICFAIWYLSYIYV